MTNEEIVNKIQSGENDLLYPLWEQNKPLIVKTIFKYHCQEFPPEITESGKREPNNDLMQESYLCLMASVEDFTLEMECKFITFYLQRLSWWLIRYINENKPVKIPAVTMHLYRRYTRYLDDYYMEFGRYPDNSEVCKTLQISQKQLNHIKGINPTPVSLNKVVDSSDEITELFELIPDTAGDIDFTVPAYNEELASIWGIVDRACKPRESKIIDGRYRQNLTLRDISKQFDLSPERVRIIEEQALEKLRHGKAFREIAGLSEGQEWCYYDTSLSHYKNNIFESNVERIAIRNSQRRKHHEEDISKLEQELIEYFGNVD